MFILYFYKSLLSDSLTKQKPKYIIPRLKVRNFRPSSSLLPNGGSSQVKCHRSRK